MLNTRDVSDRKELEAQLVHQAFHDGLTGLANRTLFAERVEHALGRSGPDDPAVLFIDLDDFKHVNDSLGHAAGDQLLVAAARRLQGCLRPTDAEAAEVVAGRVLDTLHQPFGLNGRTIPIKASLGVAVGRPGVDQAEELLCNADVAMYAAKAGGKDRYELLRPDRHEGREDTALANAIVKLSHTLQLHTVAEGIGHAVQATHLAQLGCQTARASTCRRPSRRVAVGIA